MHLFPMMMIFKNMNAIKLLLDYDMFANGVRKYIIWDYKKLAHAIIFGQTGSGKTYLLKLILARIGLYIQNSEIILCDFKFDDDFTFLSNCSNFYRYKKCFEGLIYIMKVLNDRQSGKSQDRHFVLFVFDEWASFLSNLEKKEAEQAKKYLSTLLMLGRSFNVHVMISQQRCDSVYFNSARDNFSVIIGLGILSKESVQMMFSDYKDVIYPVGTTGVGWALCGNRLFKALVPKITNFKKINEAIISAVTRFN